MSERTIGQLHLTEVAAKCEQYWNERGINDSEIHAILGFIHSRIESAAAELARLAATNAEQEREIGRLRVMERALEIIACKPIGEAEASHAQVLEGIELIAKTALATPQPPTTQEHAQ